VASRCTKDISRTLFVSLMKKGFLELDGWQKSASRLLQDGLMGSVGASKKKSSTQRNRNVSYRPLAAKGHRKGQAKVLEQKQRYPATLSQQAYWYAYQSNPNDASNHTHICAQIEGDLVYSVLHAAFQRLVNLQAALRTRFEESDGTLWQYLGAEDDFQLEVIDGSHMACAQTATNVHCILEEYLCRPFELERQHPIRALLLQLTAQKHILLIVIHHIQSDGMSNLQVARQLSQHYRECLHQGPLNPQPCIMDAMLWGEEELEYLQSAAAQHSIVAWKEMLSDFAPMVDWPFDHANSMASTGTVLPHVLSVRPDPSLMAMVATAFGPGVTVWNRFQLATYCMLLRYLTGCAHITIGVPIHGRRHDREKQVVGLRMKVMPLCIKVDDTTSVQEVMAIIDRTSKQAYRHHQFPLGKVFEITGKGKNSFSSRPYHSLLNQKEEAAHHIDLPDIRCTPYRIFRQGVKADIVISLSTRLLPETEMAAPLELQYDPSVFSDVEISRMVDRWLHIQQQSARHTTLPFRSFNCLLPGEWPQLELLSGSCVKIEYPIGTLHEFFLQQAIRTPSASALISKDGCLSYGQLDAYASTITDLLFEQGHVEGMAVAVIGGRTTHLVAALLGVLQSGSPFVPIDAALPAERIALLLRQVDVHLCLVDPTAGLNLTCQGVKMIPIPAFPPSTVPVSKDIRRTVPLESPAYILFTSGSTGTPKGAMVSHHAITNRLHSMIGVLGFGPTDRSLFRSSPSFDVSLPEIFLPLFTGGSVVMPTTADAPFPEELSPLIAKFGITYLHLVPSALRAFLDHPVSSAANNSLRVIWSGGEALTRELVRRCRSSWRARLIHGYGPTEAAVGVTYYDCTDDSEATMPNPPIGRPVPNVSVWVMDDAARPLAPGMRGEIWIGGVQTGLGYVNDAVLTASKFLCHPLGSGADVRLYRTGDLGRFRPDGNLECLGRIDDQVKILGHRVEPAEVESVLYECVGVRTAQVLSEIDDAGIQRLRAWVHGEHLEEPKLYARLSRCLPPYMLPVRIHVLDQWPLTLQGKTDRKQLWAQSAADQDKVEHGLPLSTATEHWLADLWSELLRIPIQRRDVDFFRLGGHSLLALRMMGRIRQELEINLTLMECYAAPTLDGLAARLDVLKYAAPCPVAIEYVLPEQCHQPAPMSTGQKRMWMLQQLLVQPAAYHVTRIFSIPSTHTSTDLKSVLQTMGQRHGILRTRLWQDGEQLWQQEIPFEEWQLDWKEISAASEDDLCSFMLQERILPFELSTRSGWRARWMHASGQDPQLLIVFHHALVDEWSMNLFHSEFSLLVAGTNPTDLPRLTFRYIDFARWQQQALTPGRKETLEEYWQQRFDQMGDTAQLLSDGHLGLSGPGYSGVVTCNLDHLQECMKDCSRRLGVSGFSSWMAVWQILIARLSADREVLVAIPVSERTQPEWLSILGLCLNTLPIRASVMPEDTFSTFCRDSHDHLQRDLAHGQLPYEDIIRQGNMTYGIDHRGLPQAMFILHAEHEWSEEKALPNAPGTRQATFAKNPLALHLIERNGHCEASLVYDTSLFLETTAAALLHRFEAVATQVLAQPDIHIADILLPGEWERLLEYSGRHHVVPYPKTTLQEIFRQTAERFSGRPAVISADGSETSYADLQQQVMHIAGYLRSLGIEKEDVVAIHLQRSPALLASMLGVLKAGGAFLLLEPSLPMDRLGSMIEQARVRLVLSEEGMPSIQGFEQHTHLYGKALAEQLPWTFDECLPPDPEALAYVMFTSGSTGKPKGAMVTHQNLINRLSYSREALGFGIEDRALQKSPLSFDVCLTELLLPMFSGGVVAIPAPGCDFNLVLLADQVVSLKASYLHFVPGMLKAFLEVQGIEKVNGILKIIRCGGESLSEDLMQQCLATLDARLYQSYGPAETAVAVTLWQCLNGHGHPKPPIGRPNPNVDILLMNPQGKPVPPGMPGELWIGGAQTGYGYIHNEVETRKRFVEDPIKPDSGRRYYRSGDLAQFLPDGNLLFLGRIDDQVKVRGVRIELGDVSSALLRCTFVQDAVVLSEPDGQGSQRLRAWVTVSEHADGSEITLRSALLQLLPTYMAPFRIHVVDKIPLTPHGKTNHRALKALAAVDAEEDIARLPLTTPTEIALAGIWSDLLNKDVRHRDADFFRLGGHSLLALKMSGSVTLIWGVELQLLDIYAQTKLFALAAHIDAEALCGNAESRTIKVRSKSIAPMSFVQRRLWLLHHFMTSPSAHHVIRLLRIPNDLDSFIVRKTLRLLGLRHGILRTRLFEQDGSFWQEELPVEGWSLPWKEWTPEMGMPSDLLQVEREVPFDLSKGTLWRALWLKEGGDQKLFLVFHHALTDEWSMGLFIREFWLLVKGRAHPDDLPPILAGYADYANWQHQALMGGARQRMEEFWRKRMQGVENAARIIPDFFVGEAQPGWQARVQQVLTPELSMSVSSLARDYSVSPFLLLLGVWNLLLARMSSNRDILIGTPVSQRHRPEWQRMMGLCTSIIPIRLQVCTQLSFKEHIGRLKEEMEQSLAHAALPFSDISAMASSGGSEPLYPILQMLFLCVGIDGCKEDREGLLDTSEIARYASGDFQIVTDLGADSWKISLLYDKARFEAGRMSSWLARYVELISVACRQPLVSMDALDWLGGEEKLRLLNMGMGASHPLPRHATIDVLFDAMARQHPSSLAVEHAGYRYSYREIYTLSQAWAAHFVFKLGLQPGEVVALLLPSGIEHIVLLLAVWKSGGVVVPVDPALPAERIRYMLTDSGCRYVLAEVQHRQHLLDANIWVDASLHPIGTGSSLPTLQMHAEAPAYLMYTSGSTGHPKGIFNTHQGFVNTLLSVSRILEMRSADRVAQFSTPSFDVSLFEICLAFFNGAAVVIPKRKELSMLASFIEGSHISVAMLTPMVISSLSTKTIARLRALMTGGEEARPKDIERLASLTSIFNIYGTTEVCVWSSIHPVGPCWDTSRRISIGRPLDNVFACILDDEQQLVPWGGIGELCVSSPGITNGYHHNPSLSQERFIPNPFHTDSLLYRTGDLACWDRDGNLFYHGRMDGQVKIHGFRVETAEVASALEAIHGILQATVMYRAGTGPEAGLIAFLVTVDIFSLDETMLRYRLAMHLPGHMLPVRFHRMYNIPLNHNGKVDKSVLQALDDLYLLKRSEQAALGPDSHGETATEKRLSEIWRDVLGIDAFSREDSFFSIGGSSLQMIRLIDMIEAAWGVAIDPSSVYIHPTLRSMSRLLDEQLPDQPTSAVTDPIMPVIAWDAGKGRHVFALVGGAGSMEEFTKYHRIGQLLGDGWRVHILPDPDTSRGYFPRADVASLAAMYADIVRPYAHREKIWLLGDCIGGIDAFAVACALQSHGISNLGLIIMDVSAPAAIDLPAPKGQAAKLIFTGLPEDSGPLKEWIYRLYFSMASKRPLREWFYIAPQSKLQVFRMAVALDLFDPLNYIQRFPEAGPQAEDAFDHYLSQGWRVGAWPSLTFNAYRYKKVMRSFRPGEEEPILHALFTGLCSRRVRQKILSVSRQSTYHADLMVARTYLRLEQYKPSKLNGDLHLVMSSQIYQRGSDLGWSRYVSGHVYRHRVEGDHRSYLREWLGTTAATLRAILQS